jgi:hypothetical protein
MTLEQINAMPVSEYRDWQAYYTEEPFGDTRADLRAGIIAQTVARCMGGNKHAKPMDFMPIVRRNAERSKIIPTETDPDLASKTLRAAFVSALGPIKTRHTKLQRKITTRR